MAPEDGAWSEAHETLQLSVVSKSFSKELLLRLPTLFMLNVAEPRAALGDQGNSEEAHFSVPLHKGGDRLLNSPHTPIGLL